MIFSEHIIHANRHDSKEFKPVVNAVKLKTKTLIYADKVYPSKKNSKFLKNNGYINGIMNKAYRNKKLRKIQKRENSKITKVRPRIEKVFGTLKVKYGL